MNKYTTEKEVDSAYNTLRSTFRSGRTKEIAWRKWQLNQVWWMIVDNEDSIRQALHEDLNRHSFESTFADIASVKNDLLEYVKNIDKWASDRTPEGTPWAMRFLLRPTIRPEPLGVALIIGPWNFPFSLVIQPMIAAIAAGCAVMLKPSEVTQATQQLFLDLIPIYMDPSAVKVVTGGPAETSALIERKFDQVFFTGSTNVARHIARAAAKHLTPTVLELGGQCPAIVTKSANIDAAARSIAWAKYLNSGQICLSVNHVFAHPDVQGELVRRMAFYFNKFDQEGTENMTRIVNQKNFGRLKRLLQQTTGKIEHGGHLDEPTGYISPSVVTNVKMSDSLLSEELFGTICPIITASTQDAIDAINNLPHPLAIYVFSQDQVEIKHVISSTLSGGVTVNGALTHAMVPGAPFGGVGESGQGSYHGHYGFLAFTHMRTIARPIPLFFRLVSFTLPPYTMGKMKWLTVKKSPVFKHGQTLEDARRAANPKVNFIATTSAILLKVMVSLAFAGAIDYGLGGPFGIMKYTQCLIAPYLESLCTRPAFSFLSRISYKKCVTGG